MCVLYIFFLIFLLSASLPQFDDCCSQCESFSPIPSRGMWTRAVSISLKLGRWFCHGRCHRQQPQRPHSLLPATDEQALQGSSCPLTTCLWAFCHLSKLWILWIWALESPEQLFWHLDQPGFHIQWGEQEVSSRDWGGWIQDD